MIVTVVGVGLIGGSLALSLKQHGLATHIIGVDQNPTHLREAAARHLIDEGSTDLLAAVRRADLVLLAVPMDALLTVLPAVLDIIDNQVVIDVGSTKKALLDVVRTHPKRGRFVAVHPMAGTEFSGPEAAVPELFRDKTLVLCDAEDSAADAVARVEQVADALGMRRVYLGGAEHDMHVAYVSHISHITSFALALTVLEKERDEQRIFELASTGFSSTVRLAKSSPAMWVPIFRQNRENVLDVLDEHLRQLQHMRDVLAREDYPAFTDLIHQANHIKRILK